MKKRQRKSRATKRTIQSVFFKPKNRRTDELAPIRINSSKYIASASMRSYDHMQRDNYDATVVEVWDQLSGKLEVVITRDRHGKVETIFKHPEGREGRGIHWTVKT